MIDAAIELKKTTVTGYLGRIPRIMGQVYWNVPVTDRSFRFANAPQSGCNHLLRSQTIVVEQILRVVVVRFISLFPYYAHLKGLRYFWFFPIHSISIVVQLHYFWLSVRRKYAENVDDSITSSPRFAPRRVKVLLSCIITDFPLHAVTPFLLRSRDTVRAPYSIRPSVVVHMVSTLEHRRQSTVRTRLGTPNTKISGKSFSFFTFTLLFFLIMCITPSIKG